MRARLTCLAAAALWTYVACCCCCFGGSLGAAAPTSPPPPPPSSGGPPLPAVVSALLDHGGRGLAPNVAWDTEGERACTSCNLSVHAVVSGYSLLSPHWARFENACYYMNGVDLYRPQLLFLHDGSSAGRAYAENVAANATENEWPNHIVALDMASPPASTTLIDIVKGWWYHNNAELGNIAHVFQGHACHLAALLSTEHRRALAPPVVFDGVLASCLDVNPGAAHHVTWTHMQTLWMIESIAVQPEQHGKQLHVDDATTLRHRPATIRCYENVVVQRGCGGHALEADKFPSGTPEAMAAYRRTVFATLRLDKARARLCEPSILIYGRADQPFRRMVNAEELAAALRRASAAFNVTVLAQMPRTVFEQARVFNGADVHITVHSASVYNSIFLPDAAMLFEVHTNTWWGRGGMARFMEAGAGQVYTMVKDVRFLPQATSDTAARDADIEVLPEGIQRIVDAVLARYGSGACATSSSPPPPVKPTASVRAFIGLDDTPSSAPALAVEDTPSFAPDTTGPGRAVGGASTTWTELAVAVPLSFFSRQVFLVLVLDVLGILVAGWLWRRRVYAGRGPGL